MSKRLAINGGPPAVPEGTVRKWPPIDETDRRMVMSSLEGENHAFGPNCAVFQEEFAEWNGNQYAVSTNSGTAALHMGVAACGCGPGDEVIVPAYTWSSSATCVLHHNAIPVFVDIDFDSMNLDVELLEEAVTPRTKAIVAVHLHGLPADMDPILKIAERHGIKVIEDACQAHGAVYKGERVGTLGHCAAFSFNQNKSLCSGEGGMFVTDDEALLERAKQVWSFGETRTPLEDRDYHAYALGWMYRNNDLTAAFGRSQLAKLDDYLEQQRSNARFLSGCLEDVPGLILPRESETSQHSWYNYTLRFDMEYLGHAGDPAPFRDRIVKALKAEGVETGVWQGFILPEMTVFRAKNGYGSGCPWSCPQAVSVEYDPDSFPVARRHCASHTGMTRPLRSPNDRETVELTAKGIRKVMENIERI